ncbi:MAG: DUF3177 family protein [Cyanobacteria bacterium SBLK]|nr:DUF3177 family protein [Cyanobacteria bacterium SBLK]
MMPDIWFKPLIWMDYRLAVLFTVIAPVVLLIWAAIRKEEAMTRLLIIYWRVASLLMITVYLMIPSWTIGYFTGFAARILMPISLWFWIDINDEIDDHNFSPLKLMLTSWRWAVTVYCTLGTLAFIPFLPCGFAAAPRENPMCRAWLEPTFLYKSWFHANSTPGFLGFLAGIGLTAYLVYFIYFAVVRLGKQGRSAMEK